MRRCRLPETGIRCRSSFSQGISLSASCFRMSVSSSTCPVSDRSIMPRRCWTDFSSFVGRMTKNMTPKIRGKRSRNRIMNAFIGTPTAWRLNLERMIKQGGRNGHPRSPEFLGELGPDTRGIEASQDPASHPDPTLLKQKDVLHTDHLVIHAGDLGEVRRSEERRGGQE